MQTLLCHPLFLCPLYCCDLAFFFCLDELDWLSLDAGKKWIQNLCLLFKKINTSECIKAATQLQNFSLVTEQRQKFIVEKRLVLNYLTWTLSLPSQLNNSPWDPVISYYHLIWQDKLWCNKLDTASAQAEFYQIQEVKQIHWQS